jgi:hypothetical protein
MVAINQKTKDRYTKGLRKFKRILTKGLDADINESDTVTIITDMLEDVFGFEKMINITSEYAIKKTFCDLAIKLDGEVKLLIECKAIGLKLKDDFIRQATNYAVNEGIEWVVLTNAIEWKVYHIVFSQPVESKLLYEFNYLDLNLKNANDQEMLYCLSIEAFRKKSKYGLSELKEQKQIINKFVIGQLLMSDEICDYIRKQLKKLSPDLKPTTADIQEIIVTEVLKRDVVEGDDANDAKKKITAMQRKLARTKLKQIKE